LIMSGIAKFPKDVMLYRLPPQDKAWLRWTSDLKRIEDLEFFKPPPEIKRKTLQPADLSCHS
ncbi:hypothetical protein CEXT_92291, partial [Caerostris extrusa]